MAPAASSIIDVIGATPSVWLDRLVAEQGCDGRILAKLDYLNPGFSKKDRAARGIIRAAERAGELRPGQTVVELTSGNMGTGLAIVCGVLGYPFVAVMSEGNSIERAQMMRALGAEVVMIPQAPRSRKGEVSGEDLAKVEDAAQALTKSRGGFRADQFHHPGNAAAHYEGTGPELWDDSEASLTAFVDFAGSAGTYAGTIRALKERAPEMRGYLVEPRGAAVLSGQSPTDTSHPIQGGGYSMPNLAALGGVEVDGFCEVSGAEARAMARNLARSEGIFGGFSAGANVAAALELLRTRERGGVIGVVICDSGLKYLSTDLWAD